MMLAVRSQRWLSGRSGVGGHLLKIDTGSRERVSLAL